jgi:hypothetical protein
MSLVKFNATQPAFSGLFENFFGRDTDQFFNLARTGTGAPAVNVKEDHEAFRVEVATPGLRKEDFKVTLDNGLLTISAESRGNTRKRTVKAVIPGANSATAASPVRLRCPIPWRLTASMPGTRTASCSWKFPRRKKPSARDPGRLPLPEAHQ